MIRHIHNNQYQGWACTRSCIRGALHSYGWTLMHITSSSIINHVFKQRRKFIDKFKTHPLIGPVVDYFQTEADRPTAQEEASRPRLSHRSSRWNNASDIENASWNLITDFLTVGTGACPAYKRLNSALPLTTSEVANILDHIDDAFDFETTTGHALRNFVWTTQVRFLQRIALIEFNDQLSPYDFTNTLNTLLRLFPDFDKIAELLIRPPLGDGIWSLDVRALERSETCCAALWCLLLGTLDRCSPGRLPPPVAALRGHITTFIDRCIHLETLFSELDRIFESDMQDDRTRRIYRRSILRGARKTFAGASEA